MYVADGTPLYDTTNIRDAANVKPSETESRRRRPGSFKILLFQLTWPTVPAGFSRGKIEFTSDKKGILIPIP